MVFVPFTGFLSIYAITGGVAMLKENVFVPSTGFFFIYPASRSPLNLVVSRRVCGGNRIRLRNLSKKIQIFFKIPYFMGCGAKQSFRLVGMSYIPYPYHIVFPHILYIYIHEVLFSGRYPLHVYASYRNCPMCFYKYYR